MARPLLTAGAPLLRLGGRGGNGLSNPLLRPFSRFDFRARLIRSLKVRLGPDWDFLRPRNTFMSSIPLGGLSAAVEDGVGMAVLLRPGYEWMMDGLAATKPFVRRVYEGRYIFGNAIQFISAGCKLSLF